MVPGLYSHSRLSSFENCPKQFHFRYVLKIPSASEGIEAFVGKRVHEVLERLHQFADRGLVPGLEKVLQRFHALWDESFDAERIRIARKGVPLSFYKSLGERCIQNYYRRQYPFDGSETLGLEERVVFDLDDSGRYRIQGIIDRIARARDGVIEIQDYKTGQRIPSQKRLDQDRQLALYQIGAAQRFGWDQPMRLVWHYVAAGQVRTSTRSADQIDDLRHRTIARIDQIREERDFEPRKSGLCDWCEYKALCPAWVKPDEPRPPTEAAPRSTETAARSTEAAARSAPASPQQRQLQLL